MSKKYIILSVAATLVFIGAGCPKTKNQANEPQMPNAWPQIVKYHCEQSGGTFIDNICHCPFEVQLGQTSQSMYDKHTGQCQTTAGGSGGSLGQAMEQCIGLRLALDECKTKESLPDNTQLSFHLLAGNGIPQNTIITSASVPKQITLSNSDKNNIRELNISMRPFCFTGHPFGFQTYSGDFYTAKGDKLNRLSYPEIGDGSLFVVDEYGFTLKNGQCLTFAFDSVIHEVVKDDGTYDKKIYTKELDAAEKIMKGLAVVMGKE